MKANPDLKFSLLILFIFTFSYQSLAQGIRGSVLDANGQALPFATIYIRNLETGTTTNAEGYFEYKLPSGKYDIVFQYLGYKSLLKYVEVNTEFVRINIQLEPQAFMLKDVVINGGKEDPAYTIMRKAIAKSKYHLLQLDSYTAQVYMKGSGRLIKSPFFLRKKMAKEGIDSTTAYVSESIREIIYTRPNNYAEQVISIRSNGDDNNTSPSDFINGSFYEPQIANAISPLSAKAFAYYRFEYLGTFKDRDYEVSKIRVIPRSKGDGVFAGEIFIIEDYWSIHSLNLMTTYMGIEFAIKQIYNPIENKAWLPVSHDFNIHGTFFGFEFEYKYLATISKYDIVLNQDLVADIVVIDEKVDKELAIELKKQNANISNELISKMDTGKELTRKDLRKLMRNYEKMEREGDTIPDITSIRSVKIDSLAHNKDSLFWKAQRPVPLTAYEVKGYRMSDSLALVSKNEAEGDTIKTKKGKEGFHLKDILLGNVYKLADKTHLEIETPLKTLNFNTIEGYNFFYKLKFTKTFENKHGLEIAPKFRYAFARERVSGLLQTTYRFGEVGKEKSIVLNGGRYVSQLNDANPILPIINSLTTLLLEQNYMKLYEKEFISLKFNSKISEKYSFNIKAEYANRLPLANNTNHVWVNNSNRTYTSNTPLNSEMLSTAITEHQAFLTSFNFSFKPWLKFRVKNEKKIAIQQSSPEFKFKYKGALAVGNADIAYHNIELDMKHSLDFGIKGTLNFRLAGGTFLSDEKMSFIDFKHFDGNRTPIQLKDAVSNYRLLPYYEPSTKGAYANILTHYQFRKFVLSRFGFIQDRGIKESVFVNYLGSNSSKNYTEVGYSIENIFRVFRVEGIASFQNGKYRDWGVRVGIATKLANFISIN